MSQHTQQQAPVPSQCVPPNPYPSQQSAQGYPSQPPAQGYPSQPPAQAYPSQPPAQGYPSQPPAHGYPSQAVPPSMPQGSMVGWAPQQGVAMPAVSAQPYPPNLPPVTAYPTAQPITFGSKHGWNDPPVLADNVQRSKNDAQPQQQESPHNIYNPADYQPSAQHGAFPRPPAYGQYVGFDHGGHPMPNMPYATGGIPPNLPTTAPPMQYTAPSLQQTREAEEVINVFKINRMGPGTLNNSYLIS
ncbi:Annexin A7 [Cichlidogyrus casuarinus]|uniref:Annexin A7 n=1 Tax=Cichlidogyrus casuarinus TaxID=1844966 RepID=A0ABD2QCX4_9PLAT